MGKDKDQDEPVGPFGGWFATIGGFAGMFVGFDVGEILGAFIGMIVGGYIGLAVEHIVYRIVMAIVFLLILLSRILRLAHTCRRMTFPNLLRMGVSRPPFWAGARGAQRRCPLRSLRSRVGRCAPRFSPAPFHAVLTPIRRRKTWDQTTTLSPTPTKRQTPERTKGCGCMPSPTTYLRAAFSSQAPKSICSKQEGSASRVCYVDFGAVARDLEAEFQGLRVAGRTYLFRRR